MRLFDENTPTDEKKLEQEHIFPEVRRAEARYFPMQIRNTLEGTGHWGQVRVVPADADALDVQISGKIVESNGQLLRIDIAVADATGRLWFKREYQQTADTRSYKDQSGRPRDPFQNLYSTLANDLLAYRQQLPVADLENVRRVSELRFAKDLAPYAFQSYLTEDKKKGSYQVVRLPADDDPMLVRMDRIRERDYALLDTVNEHYSLFSENMSEPYTNWRRYSYAELEAEDEAKRSALTRKLLGAAAIVGGLVVGSEANTYAGQAAATGAIFGGAYAIKSGFDKGAEVKMHSDSLEAARGILPGRSPADGRRGRRAHSAAQRHGRRAVPRVAATVEGTLRERDRSAGPDACSGRTCCARPGQRRVSALRFLSIRHIAPCWRAGRNCLRDSFWSDAWGQAGAARFGLRRTVSAAASSP